MLRKVLEDRALTREYRVEFQCKFYNHRANSTLRAESALAAFGEVYKQHEKSHSFYAEFVRAIVTQTGEEIRYDWSATDRKWVPTYQREVALEKWRTQNAA